MNNIFFRFFLRCIIEYCIVSNIWRYYGIVLRDRLLHQILSTLDNEILLVIFCEKKLAKEFESSNIHLQTRFYRNLTPHDFDMGNIGL